jgi:hypothetical protein
MAVGRSLRAFFHCFVLLYLFHKKNEQAGPQFYCLPLKNVYFRSMFAFRMKVVVPFIVHLLNSQLKVLTESLISEGKPKETVGVQFGCSPDVEACI